MKKDSIGHIVIAFCLSFLACELPTNSDPAEFPKQPDWLDIKLEFEKLPSFKEPAELIYNITVIGEDSTLPLTYKGDTLNHLLLKFSSSDWVVGLNDDADTVWQNKIEFGQSITLSPVFQMDTTLIPPRMLWINDSTSIPIDPDTMHNAYSPDGDNTRHFWSQINLGAAFSIKEIPKAQADSMFSYQIVLAYELFFDYRTGDYNFGIP